MEELIRLVNEAIEDPIGDADWEAVHLYTFYIDEALYFNTEVEVEAHSEDEARELARDKYIANQGANLDISSAGDSEITGIHLAMIDGRGV